MSRIDHNANQQDDADQNATDAKDGGTLPMTAQPEKVMEPVQEKTGGTTLGSTLKTEAEQASRETPIPSIREPICWATF